MENPDEPYYPDPSAFAPPRRAGGELPLFPLDMVLFPFMAVPLHIFEERYREMIRRCLQENIPFGIVRAIGIRPGTGTVETEAIGCEARITRAEHLEDGRINIEIQGTHRFRLLDTHEQQSYRTGLIEPYEDNTHDGQTVTPLAEETAKLLREFLTRSLAAMGRDAGEFGLPAEPEQLSFVASCVLPLDDDDKQSLLVERDTAARLSSVREVLHREVLRLRRTAETREVVWKPLAPDTYDKFRCPN